MSLISLVNIAYKPTDRLYNIDASSIVIFFTLCYIFTSSAYTRGREKYSQYICPLLIKIFTVISPSHYRILLAYATVMFILSTTHAALSISELLQGFVFKIDSTPGGPAEFYRINVFPKRKAIYIVNVCPFLFFFGFGVSFVYFLVLCVLSSRRFLEIPSWYVVIILLT